MQILNNLPYSDRYFSTDWYLEVFKEAKTTHVILCIYVNFKIVFSYAQLHLLQVHIGIQSVPTCTAYGFSINELFLII